MKFEFENFGNPF